MEKLDVSSLAREFADYSLVLSGKQLEQVQRYLELLLHWNRRLNLTGLRDPRRIVRELLCESMYLTRVLSLRGRLLDIGSGAGIPGLALKMAVPELDVVLVEADRRKSVFLKEAIISLQLSEVSVHAGRLVKEVCERLGRFRFATTRAVDARADLLDLLRSVVGEGGCFAAFTTRQAVEHIKSRAPWLSWSKPVPIPHAKDRVILSGMAV